MATPLNDPAMQKLPPAYEFTKRKRWADLIVAEEADGIPLVLSTAREVLYCSPILTQFLGWKDTELIDRDLADFVNLDDRETFCQSFRNSVTSNTEFLCSVHLDCKSAFGYVCPPDSVLFEFKGYPSLEGLSVSKQCLFVRGRPAPGRNALDLDSVLDAKTTKQDHLITVDSLRSLVLPTPPPPFSMSLESDALFDQNARRYQTTVPRGTDEGSSTTTGSQLAALIPDGHNLDSTSQALESANQGTGLSGPSVGEDLNDDSTRRKKQKKLSNGEQYVCVTCGRTDSPEWRKGPLGPKTLCNACGLRWAKLSKKVDEPSDGTPSGGAS